MRRILRLRESIKIDRVNKIRKLRQLLARCLLAKSKPLPLSFDFSLLLLLLPLAESKQTKTTLCRALGQTRDTLLSLQAKLPKLLGGLELALAFCCKGSAEELVGLITELSAERGNIGRRSETARTEELLIDIASDRRGDTLIKN